MVCRQHSLKAIILAVEAGSDAVMSLQLDVQTSRLADAILLHASSPSRSKAQLKAFNAAMRTVNFSSVEHDTISLSCSVLRRTHSTGSASVHSRASDIALEDV